MILMKTSGLQISGGNYPVSPGNSEVYVAEPLGQPPANSGNSGAAQAGKMSLAIGLGEVLSQWNIPNAVDFVEGIWGSFNDNEKLISKFDSEFRTLGNGKFELNDVLAFPVNWGVKLADHLNLLPNRKSSTSDPSNNSNDSDDTDKSNKGGNKSGSNNKSNKDNKGGTGHAR